MFKWLLWKTEETKLANNLNFLLKLMFLCNIQKDLHQTSAFSIVVIISTQKKKKKESV